MGEMGMLDLTDLKDRTAHIYLNWTHDLTTGGAGWRFLLCLIAFPSGRAECPTPTCYLHFFQFSAVSAASLERRCVLALSL